ncbi:MAG: DUF3096 domain-containing protein [Candidatus Brocadiae bacterium]|nr:DUF3096 domain-containing protein [Candidatus Brocadiia bacterium]
MKTYKNYKTKKAIAVVSIILGILILAKPEIVIYIIAFYLILSGILSLSE